MRTLSRPAYYTDPPLFSNVTNSKYYFAPGSTPVMCPSLKSAGDYLRLQPVRSESYSRCAAADGAIRSFFNVCMHRAHQLVEGSGNKRVLVCPYHCVDLRTSTVTCEKHPTTKRCRVSIAKKFASVKCAQKYSAASSLSTWIRRHRPMAEWFPDVEEQLRSFVPHIDELKPIYLEYASKNTATGKSR